MNKTYILFSLTIVLFWNPIMLSLLLNSVVAGFLFTISIALFTYIIASLKRDILKIIWVNFFIVIGVLLNAEVIFRHVFNEYNIPNLYRSYDNFYFNKPLLNTHFTDPEFNSIYLTNIQGFRVKNIVNQHAEIDSCDVLFIGDSFTQGAQVDFEYMFSSIFEEKNPEMKVVNAGISGANIIDEFYFITNLGISLHPKKIIVQLCVNNDFFNIIEHKSGIKEWLREKSALYRSASIIIPSHFNNKIPRCIDPFFEDEINNKNYNICYTKSSPIKEKDKDILLYSINRINSISKKIGAELIILLIPTKEQIYTEYFTEVVNAYQLDTNYIDLNYPNYWLTHKMDSLNIDYIDVTDEFRKQSSPMFFKNDIHLTKEGHAVVATQICDYLKK